MPHLALLGDSIFDNAAYTSGGPDVAAQVRKHLPPDWSVSLLAVDGAMTGNIPDQMQRLPKEATHLVLSVGGNNALAEASRLGISFFGVLDAPNSKGLDSLSDVSEEFEAPHPPIMPIPSNPLPSAQTKSPRPSSAWSLEPTTSSPAPASSNSASTNHRLQHKRAFCLFCHPERSSGLFLTCVLRTPTA